MKALICFVGASLFLLNCTPKKTQSKPEAFEILRGDKISRIYAAYNPREPEVLSWYRCDDEDLDPNTPVDVEFPASGDLPLALNLARAFKNDPPLEQPTSVSSVQSPPLIESAGAKVSKTQKTVRVRLTERLTNAHFESPTSGVGCKVMVAGAESTGAADKFKQTFESQRKDPDYAKKIINSTLSCGTFAMSSFILGASAVETLRTHGTRNPFVKRTHFGFGTEPITKGAVGMKILFAVGGFASCAFSAQDFFKKAAERSFQNKENELAFFEYMHKVVKLSESVSNPQAWASEFSADVVARLLPLQKQVDASNLELALAESKADLKNGAFTEAALQATRLASGIYSPLYVATWNSMMQHQVNETKPAQQMELFGKINNGINHLLANFLKLAENQ